MLTHEMLKLTNAMKLAVILATNSPSLSLASAEVRFTLQDLLVSRRTMGEATPSCKVAMSSTNTVLVEVQQVESMVM